ncbi:ComEC/Rec2 family competence protein [Marinitoga litoralis]|uniref:ComEC/Rec2 family competence protein n=1 Tax=Marinitoga litoralis TaxID=570855 RepID=UPI0019614641|nr:ComEC/Rec2 family competence protein [Marinitoga litoralis]MBM7559216.1 competence protein ComEC [Marinitoga litoralis]
MPFFVNLFISSISLILIIKGINITTAILFMAVVFFSFKYSFKTKIIMLIILSFIFFRTILLLNIPKNTELGILGKIVDKNNNFYVVKTDKIYFDNNWEIINEKIYFSYNKFSTDKFEIGNKIYIIGEKNNDEFKVEYMANSAEGSIYSLRGFLKNRLYNNFPYENNNILFSVIFGGLRGKNAEVFKNSGLLHLFAVSGFHVYIIYSLLYIIYSKTLIPINTRRILTIIFLIIYLITTGFSDSAIRASFILILIEINKILGLYIDSKNILGLVGVINLLYNPNVIFSVGFLMSYSAALSILFLIERSKNPFLITLSAFLAILPWSIIYFKGFSILGVFLSVVFVPIVYSLMFFSFIYIIIPLPEMINTIVNNYIEVVQSFLKYISDYIMYINLEGNSIVLLYIISILALILFHVLIKIRYREE